MEITQKDRDALRTAQQGMVSEKDYRIGSIVEHKIQDPRKYKQMSRQEQGLSEKAQPPLPKPEYKSKRLDGRPAEDQNSINSAQQPGESGVEELADLPISIEDVQANMWLHMDKIELEKMEWMTSKAEETYRERMRMTTHFDKDGRALPSGTVAKEEDGQPAYDIESLVEMLDSDYDPRKTYAMNLISKIAALATFGYYDGSFDENIHQVLIRNCLLRVRHHIDSTNETVCLSALKCLRSLLCNTAFDEIFLDRCNPLTSHQAAGLWLQTDIMMRSAEDAYDLKDQECAEIDAVFALVKQTNLLIRLRYLLTTKLGEFQNAYSDCILDILLRIARHSREVCFVMVYEDLINVVVTRFMPSNISSESKLRQSLAIRTIKLVRILAQASNELRSIQSSVKIKIPKSLITALPPYYYIDCYTGTKKDGNHLFILYIETLRLMRTLASNDNHAKEIMDMVVMDLSYLCKILKNLSNLESTKPIASRISLDWQIAAHLIDLIGTIANYEALHHIFSVGAIFNTYVGPITIKWIHDLIKDTYVPHLDVSVAVSNCVGLVKRHKLDSDKKMTCFSVMNSLLLKSNDKSRDDTTNAGLELYNNLLQLAIQKSQVCDILEIDGRRRDPKMLPSFGCLNFNTTTYYDYKFNSVVEHSSPFVLLEMFVDLLRSNPSKRKEFMNSMNSDRYCGMAMKYHALPNDYELTVQNSIMAQREITIMAKMILLKAEHMIELYDDRTKCLQEMEKPSFKRSDECYSEFFFNSISIIALINQKVEDLVSLRDQLLQTVIFNEKLHKQLAAEYHKPTTDDAYWQFYHVDCISGDTDYKSLDARTLFVLKMIYLGCEQPGRFWIFQPFIEYYKLTSDLDAADEEDKKRLVSGKWFASTFMYGANCSAQADCNDSSIVAGILALNSTFMRHIIIYNHLAIRPNLEEYLCLVGSIFLDDKLMFDEKISRGIQDNILSLLYECAEDGNVFGDASKKIETLGLLLSDFFNKIVDQYEATSYGNVTFSNFLLLFLSPKSDKVFKKKLFSEKLETCLTQIRLTRGAVWAAEPLYFNHIEEDSEVKMLMKLARPHLAKNSFLEAYVKFQTTD